jgi:outer membrane biogenesis lipoprotein LolB
MKALIALLAAALLTSCAVTYPTKSGNVTLEFSPTHEMLEAAGMKLSTRTLRDK